MDSKPNNFFIVYSSKKNYTIFSLFVIHVRAFLLQKNSQKQGEKSKAKKNNRCESELELRRKN